MTLKDYIESKDFFRFCDVKTYQCDCSVFYNYLWCKHSLASMILRKEGCVPQGLTELIGPKKVGRPSKRGKALDKI